MLSSKYLIKGGCFSATKRMTLSEANPYIMRYLEEDVM